MVTLETGETLEPADNAPVYCELHGVTVAWGDLTPIQQLAVAEGIDIEGGICILLS